MKPRPPDPARAKSLPIAALALVLAAAGCGSDTPKPASTVASDWDSVVAAAEAEGSLMLYSSSSPETNNVVTAAFQKKYPKIKVDVLRVTTPESEQRAEVEFNGHAAGADVIINTDEKWHQDKSSVEGFFLPVVGPDVKAATGVLQDQDKTVLVTANPHGYAWNTTLTSPTLDFSAVVDPAYRGRLGIYDFCPSDQNVLEFLLWDQHYGGDDFLRKLAAQQPRFYSNAVATAQALGSGEIAIALPMTRSAYGDVPQIQMAYMSSTTIASPFFASITGWATHPNAAQVFLNWALTAEGQAPYAEQNKIAVAGTNVPGAEKTLDQVTVVHSASYDQKTIDDYRAKLEQIFSHSC